MNILIYDNRVEGLKIEGEKLLLSFYYRLVYFLLIINQLAIIVGNALWYTFLICSIIFICYKTGEGIAVAKEISDNVSCERYLGLDRWLRK